MVHRWGISVVSVVARRFLDGSVRQLNHEAFPSGIVIPFAGVFGAGEAVRRRELERAESVGVTDPGLVHGLLGREVVHEKVDVVGDRARRLEVGVVRR